jgi:hypothetical protein
MIDVNSILELIQVMVRGGLTPEEACKKLCMVCPEQQVKQALDAYNQLAVQTRATKEPSGLEAKNLNSWYTGPQAKDTFWPPLKEYLANKALSPAALSSLDDSSTKIVSYLPHPAEKEFSRRGLVLGYVQSGKTANFTAVIAKAADVGYKLIIVLSGLHNGLRAQTQVRLDKELVSINPSHWYPLTKEHEDFLRPPSGVDAYLSGNNPQKVLCVVKKNGTVLRRLIKWFTSASKLVLEGCPVLIIDDEADQASVNSSGSAQERTAINKLLLNMLSKLRRVAYVGYTATPYANLFIDPAVPEDIYPRDFILDLPRPTEYFGPERIFGREQLTPDEPEFEGLDMIRHIDEKTEVPLLKPKGTGDVSTFQPQLTESLRSALLYFWMACAARVARGQLVASSKLRHASMLVHTTFYTNIHDRFYPLIDQLRKDTLKKLKSGNKTLLKQLNDQWDDEQQRVPSAELNENPNSFNQVKTHLDDVLSRAVTIVENGRSELRLVYGDDPSIQVVVGGNTLARGLTLEGLVVSYFIRASTAYDTLLQMGRWFGYRKGYADLPRLWITPELEGYFRDLSTVEQEIRNDIKRYELEGLTPLDFGVKIRTHPALSITSSLKMQKAVDCSVSYSNRRLQTILFKHKDAAWLAKNLLAARELISKKSNAKLADDRYWVLSDFDASDIIEFLGRYSFHENSIELRADLFQEYIRQQNQCGALQSWNVVIVGVKPDPAVMTIEMGLGIKVPMIQRTRLKGTGDANIGALMSDVDRVADLNLSKQELSQYKGEELQARRNIIPAAARKGLLLLYPIQKDSQPKVGSKLRLALGAAEHVVGVGIVFPRAEKETALSYKTVDLSSIPREIVSLPLEEEDAE